MSEANRSIESGGGLELILTAVVAAPVLEEILFRGIVFRSLKRAFPVWVSILLSSVLFGAYHMNTIQAVYAVFMGIIAAIIYDKTNHLIYPVLVHAANNLIGAVQSFIPSETGVFIVNMIALVMIIPMFCTIYQLLQCRGTSQIPVRFFRESGQ